MPTEAAATATGRPRPWLIVLLAIVAGFFLMVNFWPSAPATPAAAPRTQVRGTGGRGDGAVNPQDLQVKLDSLKAERPTPDATERNPFRFQPKAPPPPPPSAMVTPPPKPMVPDVPTGPVQPPPPPPPPPITMKFIGIVEGRQTGGKVAAFSDPPACRRVFYAREGEVVDGRYRLLKIGVESVVMEYPDGRGRTTIRLGGQECVGK